MPHPSTLEKITTRCGPETIAQLNRALLVKAGAAKVVRLDKVRADTTVVAANVAYPTDSGLLVRAITLLTMLVALIHTAGGAAPHQGAGPPPGGGAAGPVDLGAPQAAQRRGQGQGAADHR